MYFIKSEKTPSELFCLEKIISEIESPQSTRLKLDLFPSLDSTNQYLLNHIADGRSPWAVLSEEQTAGRGRSGKSWHSTPGGSIALSLLWKFTSKAPVFSSLSIAVGVMIIAALKKIVPNGLTLKWPNDILYQSRKLAGILLETKGSAVVIGIGLNTNLASSSNKEWIGLSEIAEAPFSRNHIAGAIINQLLLQLPLYEAHGFRPFMSRFQEYDFLAGKKITLALPDKQIIGVATGINHQGELLLTDHTHKTRAYCYGEASVLWEK